MHKVTSKSRVIRSDTWDPIGSLVIPNVTHLCSWVSSIFGVLVISLLSYSRLHNQSLLLYPHEYPNLLTFFPQPILYTWLRIKLYVSHSFFQEPWDLSILLRYASSPCFYWVLMFLYQPWLPRVCPVLGELADATASWRSCHSFHFLHLHCT